MQCNASTFLDTNVADSLQWYTKKEQGFRTGIWFSFNGIGIIVGSLLAYGIAQATKNHSTTIAPWKILFVSTGVFTIVIGIVFLFVMPDSQLNARWLSDNDKRLAVERVRINEQGIGNKHFKWYQFKEAMLDPMTWAFAFFALASGIPIGGVTNFFSQLVSSLCAVHLFKILAPASPCDLLGPAGQT
jgi:ACS family allantoate permease-like MFS transporter